MNHTQFNIIETAEECHVTIDVIAMSDYGLLCSEAKGILEMARLCSLTFTSH
jgi:cellobiose-specific phosphotransferase system component IIB